MSTRSLLVTLAAFAAFAATPFAQKNAARSDAKASGTGARLEALKQEAAADVESRQVFSQQMVDQIFSYGELGFQEFETTRYLADILKRNGFSVQEGIAGIPTAFMATWGSGKPVLALGSDIDCIPQASQRPGVGWHEPIIEGAPGHGEGHNSGGRGKPVPPPGSESRCVPGGSRSPGRAGPEPIIEGAPGPGEGHNSGQAVN